MPLDVESLLARIGYAGTIDDSLTVLQDLKTAFLLSVSFENIDIHIPREIRLIDGAAEEKIVRQRRGGFCYECNYLFYQLLSQIGFDVVICSARMKKNGALSLPYEHMVLLVTLDSSTFLVDVGNGESVRVPMNLNSNETHQAPEGKRYRIGALDGNPTLENSQRDASDWNVQFAIDPIPRRLEDFSDRCYFQQTSPQSVFTTQPMATLALTDGRRTIRGRQFSEMREGQIVRKITLQDEQEYYDCLRDDFGLIFAENDQKFWRP